MAAFATAEHHAQTTYVTRECRDCGRKEVTGFDTDAYRSAEAWVDDHIRQNPTHWPVATSETHQAHTYSRED